MGRLDLGSVGGLVEAHLGMAHHGPCPWQICVSTANAATPPGLVRPASPAVVGQPVSM